MTGYRNLNPNTQGILCLLVALVFLTFSDSIIKWLSPRYALHEIMLYRGCFAILVVLAFIKLEGGLYLLKTRRPWLHLLRGGLLELGTVPVCPDSRGYARAPQHAPLRGPTSAARPSQGEVA